MFDGVGSTPQGENVSGVWYPQMVALDGKPEQNEICLTAMLTIASLMLLKKLLCTGFAFFQPTLISRFVS